MANDLNRHECIGRLGNDPEIRYLADGKAVARISVACGESWKDQAGQKQERTTWITYVAFGRLAEIMGEYLTKGSKVFLSGKLQVRKWQDQSGNDRYTTEIVASDMQMLDSKGSDNHQAPAQQQSAPPQSAPPPAAAEFEDDIPF